MSRMICISSRWLALVGMVGIVGKTCMGGMAGIGGGPRRCLPTNLTLTPWRAVAESAVGGRTGGLELAHDDVLCTNRFSPCKNAEHFPVASVVQMLSIFRLPVPLQC